VDIVRSLLDSHGYTNRRCHEEFGVGITWLSDFRRNEGRAPSAQTMQLIYEQITGQALIKEEAPTIPGAKGTAEASKAASHSNNRLPLKEGQEPKGAQQ
jgi:hypothetical protein